MSTHVQNHLYTHMHIPEECWVCMHAKASAFNSVFSKMRSLSFSYSLGFYCVFCFFGCFLFVCYVVFGYLVFYKVRVKPTNNVTLDQINFFP